MCCVDSFVIGRLISTGGGLLYIPMELGMVSAGTVDFIVGIDKKLWIGFVLFEDCYSFFGTQGAVFSCKGFGYTDWIALPDDAAGYPFSLVGWIGV